MDAIAGPTAVLTGFTLATINAGEEVAREDRSRILPTRPTISNSELLRKRCLSN